jgi:hypothetical protein
MQMTALRTLALALGSVAVATFATVANAFPIASSGEGASVLVGGTSDIVATYQGNSASFSNDLYLMWDGAAGKPGDDGNLSNDVFIFNNHSSAVGSTVNLGAFAPGTELEFRLHVNNTDDDFFTGAASRNPDSHAHARVQANWEPNTTLVSFEDLFNGPFDFNDLSFSFTNTVSSVPEPATLALFGLGLLGLASAKRKNKR